MGTGNPYSNGENTEENEADDNAPTRPWILRAAPLKSKETTDDGDNEDGSTGKVQLHGTGRPEGNALLGLAGWGMKEEENDGQGHGAQRKVDVEAPSPGNVVGEGAAQVGADHLRRG